jgi:hypothetical protein
MKGHVHVSHLMPVNAMAKQKTSIRAIALLVAAGDIM